MAFFASRTGSGARGTPDVFATHSKAPDNHLLAHIDGGARGNPGPAGYGVVITDSSGRKIAGLSEYLGHQTNNYAEYSGLLAALKFAVQNNFKALKVVSDSELMVKQIRGVYKVKNQALKELHQRAQELIGKLDWFQIQHVLREKNREADGLANAAMDKGMGRNSNVGSDVAASRAAVSLSANQEFAGIVRGGVVELLNGELADGTRVQVRVKK
jgi:ribonuclease HI